MRRYRNGCLQRKTSLSRRLWSWLRLRRELARMQSSYTVVHNRRFIEYANFVQLYGRKVKTKALPTAIDVVGNMSNTFASSVLRHVGIAKRRATLYGCVVGNKQILKEQGKRSWIQV